MLLVVLIDRGHASLTKQQRETDDENQEKAASPCKGLGQHFRGPRPSQCRGTPAQGGTGGATQTADRRTGVDPNRSRKADRDEAARLVKVSQRRFPPGFSREADADADSAQSGWKSP